MNAANNNNNNDNNDDDNHNNNNSMIYCIVEMECKATVQTDATVVVNFVHNPMADHLIVGAFLLSVQLHYPNIRVIVGVPNTVTVKAGKFKNVIQRSFQPS